ncbi:MAG: hypothetical protein JXR89_06295 [Deltaproteobacteria bacterium]|nr:hypothetical protein [Deltaproteobacteria bacterium]
MSSSRNKAATADFRVLTYSRVGDSRPRPAAGGQARNFELADFNPAPTRRDPAPAGSSFRSLEFPVGASPERLGPNSPEVEAQVEAIFNAARAEAEGQRAEIVFAARGEAADIRSEAEDDCVQLRRQTEEQARQEGLQRADEELNERLARLDRLLEGLSTSAAYCLEKYRQSMVDLALSCARKIVCRQITLEPGIINECVDEVLQESGIQGRIRLLLNPEDLSLVENEKTRLLSRHPKIHELTLEIGEGLERGGCVVETPTGRIDASLPGKLEELKRLLGS